MMNKNILVTLMKYSLRTVVVVLFFLMVSSPSFGADEFDKYGGWTKIKGKATGFFHTEKKDGRWWLITPDGNVFLSIGVNIARFSGDTAPSLGSSPYKTNVIKKFKNEKEWRIKTVQLLDSWGFNTIGAWSDKFSDVDKKVPYIITLNLGSAGSSDWRTRSFPDVFSPDFEQKLKDSISKARHEELLRDPYLIGYVLDNEIPWGPKVIKDTFESKEGKKVLIGFLKEKYKTISAFSTAWGIEAKNFEEIQHIYKNKIKPEKEALPQISDDLSKMLGLVASRFFKVTTDAIRSKDSNHMIMGVRFLDKTPKSVVEECGKFSDVITINYYPERSDQPHGKDQKRGVVKNLLPDNWLEEYYNAADKPILITEVSFIAKDSGLPNRSGAGKADTQAGRAALFEWFLKGIASKPYIVGYHWFQYADQPKEGRFDGEANNFGLVDIKDNPYTVLTEKMKELNRDYYQMHSR